MKHDAEEVAHHVHGVNDVDNRITWANRPMHSASPARRSAVATIRAAAFRVHAERKRPLRSGCVHSRSRRHHDNGPDGTARRRTRAPVAAAARARLGPVPRRRRMPARFRDAPDAVVVPARLHATSRDLRRNARWRARAGERTRADAHRRRCSRRCAMPAAGLHGLERRSSTGARTSPPVRRRSLLTVRSRSAATSPPRCPGALVEDKGPNLALHWRARTRGARALRAFAEAALPRLPGYRLQHGDHVVELRPGRTRRQGHGDRSRCWTSRRSAAACRCSSATTSPTSTASRSSTRAAA